MGEDLEMVEREQEVQVTVKRAEAEGELQGPEATAEMVESLMACINGALLGSPDSLRQQLASLLTRHGSKRAKRDTSGG